MDSKKIEAAALSAIRDYIARATVFIVDGHRRAQPHGLGSGTLVLSPRGRLLVLTAKHLFHEGPAERECRVCWYRCTDTLEPFAPIRTEHPTADVALFLVPTEREASMRSLAIRHADVVGWYRGPTPDETVLLAGYPSELVHLELDHQRRKGAVGFTAIAYGANVSCLGREPLGRLTLEFREMVLDDDPTIRPLPSPTGMSGGALWHFDPKDLSVGVWDPSRFLKVVGVQSAWFPDDRVAIIEGGDRWIDWYSSAVASLDEL